MSERYRDEYWLTDFECQLHDSCLLRSGGRDRELPRSHHSSGDRRRS
jgi:hypothetical protein